MSMRVHFEDVRGNQGTMTEDLTLENYDGPDMWRVRIEETLTSFDDEAMTALHDLESTEREESLEKLVKILPAYPLIETATVEKGGR